MSSDIYKAPESDVDAGLHVESDFYVVSGRKFLTLFLATFSLYSLYWFYRHWAQYKSVSDEPMWPPMRAIFAIFFTHSLFRRINEKYEETIGDVSNWRHSVFAGIYVLSLIVSQVAERLSAKNIGSPITDLVTFATLPLACWILYKTQIIANRACSDPDGSANDSFTFANIVWIVLGIIFWILILIGIYDIAVGLPYDE